MIYFYHNQYYVTYMMVLYLIMDHVIELRENINELNNFVDTKNDYINGCAKVIFKGISAINKNNKHITNVNKELNNVRKKYNKLRNRVSEHRKKYNKNIELISSSKDLLKMCKQNMEALDSRIIELNDSIKNDNHTLKNMLNNMNLLSVCRKTNTDVENIHRFDESIITLNNSIRQKMSTIDEEKLILKTLTSLRSQYNECVSHYKQAIEMKRLDNKELYNLILRVTNKADKLHKKLEYYIGNLDISVEAGTMLKIMLSELLAIISKNGVMDDVRMLYNRTYNVDDKDHWLSNKFNAYIQL